MIKDNSIQFNKPASAQIFDRLRNSIISMELMPGQRIAENALASAFGVSRTPVREALINLSNIGFVEVLPQRGTYVTKLSTAKILEARFVREALEVAVVCELAEHHTPEMIEAAQEIISKQKAAARQGDALLFQQLDDNLHQTLANFIEYNRVAQLIESEKAHMDRVRNLSLQIEGQFDLIIAQHQAIITGIQTGDPKQAKEAMNMHLRDVYTALKEIPKAHPEYFID